MKRAIAIACIVTAFVLGLGSGYVLAIGLNESGIEGVYYAENWNGKSATLIIEEDGTCKYPTGDKGTWIIEDEVITISLMGRESQLTGDETSISSSQIAVEPSSHKAYIVENGVILYDCLFSKK